MAGSFTSSLHHKVMIWSGFIRLTASATVPTLWWWESEKPHHILTLQFSELVRDHAKYHCRHAGFALPAMAFILGLLGGLQVVWWMIWRPHHFFLDNEPENMQVSLYFYVKKKYTKTADWVIWCLLTLFVMPGIVVIAQFIGSAKVSISDTFDYFSTLKLTYATLK